MHDALADIMAIFFLAIYKNINIYSLCPKILVLDLSKYR